MASAKIAIPWQNEDSIQGNSPYIGIFVTADVNVVQYNSSHSLDYDDSTKCVIVTSLNAIIKETSNCELKCKKSSTSKENVTDTRRYLSLSEDSLDHPIIRRSKKHTQLNNAVNPCDSQKSRGTQINRTVLLPYLGCSKTLKSASGQILGRSSKSWETVNKSNHFKRVQLFRSQTLMIRGKDITAPEESSVNYQNLLTNRPSVKDSTGEYKPSNNNQNTKNGAVRSFYLIQASTSGPTTLHGEIKLAEKILKVGQQKYNSDLPVEYVPGKQTQSFYENINRFDKEIFSQSGVLGCKRTRNVSILHRPKSRDKATSTTSLLKTGINQNINTSIQNLLMPYFGNDKDFPSEIILKLVSKSEALAYTINDTTGKGDGSLNSSEINLLAPTLNTVPKKKKNKKGFFWNCFSNKKNTNGNGNDSDENSNTEVYFPSIVEVHNKKLKKSQDDIDSD